MLLAAVGLGTTVSAVALSDVYQDAESDHQIDGTDSGGAEPDAPTAADEEEFDGRSTAATVRLVVTSLIAVAGVTAIMMLMFIWHTSPRRRFRIATRRAEQRRSEVASDEGDNEDEVADEAEGDGKAGEDDGESGEVVDKAGEVDDEPGEAEDSEVGESRE